jgi:hypothetical protein
MQKKEKSAHYIVAKPIAGNAKLPDETTCHKIGAAMTWRVNPETLTDLRKKAREAGTGFIVWEWRQDNFGQGEYVNA